MGIILFDILFSRSCTHGDLVTDKTLNIRAMGHICTRSSKDLGADSLARIGERLHRTTYFLVPMSHGVTKPIFPKVDGLKT